MRQPVASATDRTSTQTATHARPTGADLALGVLPVVILVAVAAPALTAGALFGGTASALLQRAVTHRRGTASTDPVPADAPA